MMDIVIVRSGQDLVAFAQRQPMIEKGQTGRRILCQRDVLPVAANVVAMARQTCNGMFCRSARKSRPQR